MDAFEENKFNSRSFIEGIIANSVIVGYGFITAVDFDSVIVTLTVSDKSFAETAECKFMNLGNETFALQLEPEIGMRVLVFSPNKAAPGMFESYAQLNINEGRNYIISGSPAVYSSQFAFCLPMMKSTSQALNSLVVSSNLISLRLKHELVALLNNIEIDIKGDSSIELHEYTRNFIGCYGDLEKTFGMLPGIGGVEKEGDYTYTETYGKYSSVEKNYESGAKVTVGKAYETPFLESKGALVDSSAPVTIDLGAGAPVTLTFGDSLMTVKADTETGLDIVLTGSLKVNITADAGKFSIGNANGSLKQILDTIADYCAAITTVGGNVVPGAPYPAAADPATVAKFSVDLKTLIASILE